MATSVFPNVLNQESEVETKLWEGHFSGKTMFAAWVSAALVSLAMLVAIIAIPALRNNPYVWLFGFCFLILMWAGLIATWLYQRWSHYYEVTTQRLMHRDGILIRKVGLIELIDIDDVSFQQGPVQAALGVGTIHLSSSDTSHPSLKLRGISNVRLVADIIDEARRQERRKRGLHIEHI